MVFNIVATVLFIVAIILFSSAEDNTVGTVFLCAGNLFMILGITSARGANAEKESEADPEKTDTDAIAKEEIASDGNVTEENEANEE